VDDLKARLDDPGVQIMDMRTDEEWLGTNNRGNTRVGHVPGAVHLEWLNYIEGDDSRKFKPAAELHRMLHEAGISPEKEVVTY
jgi:thiosulfate/3-mercaptopyruvate sulfurtransferase